MKGISIRWVIALMTLAFVGLIFMQLFWLKGAYRLQEKQMTRDINHAMRQSVEQVMRKKRLNLFYKTFQTDSLEGLPKHIRKIVKRTKRWQNKKEGVLIEIDSTVDQETTNNLNKSYLKESVEIEKVVGPDSVVLHEISTTLLDVVASSGMDENPRFGSTLDSAILGDALREQIEPLIETTNFEFAVLDRTNDNPIPHLSTDKFDSRKDLSTFTVPLFQPKQFEQPPLALAIQIENTRTLLFKKLSFSLLASVILILFVGFVFVLAIKTLLKQKKLHDVKNDFFNNVTHEFKTPLSSMKIALDAINMQEVQDNPKELGVFIRALQTDRQHMEKHIEQLLHVAMLDKSELSLNRERESIQKIVSEAVNSYQVIADAKKIVLAFENSSTNILAYIDKYHLRQCLENLIDNAIKFSENGSIIKIWLDKNDEFCFIHVQDEGKGLQPKEIDQIFKPFYHGKFSDSQKNRGFGIGLSYVKGVMQSHNGDVLVESTLDTGSKFTLKIPLGS